MELSASFIRTQVVWVQLGGSSYRVVTLKDGQSGRLDIWGHWAVVWGTGMMVSLSHGRLATVGTIGRGRHPVLDSRAPCTSSCRSYLSCLSLSGCSGLDNIAFPFPGGLHASYLGTCAHVPFYGNRNFCVIGS